MESKRYTLCNTIPAPGQFDGTAIVLHHIDRVPPHIGLLWNKRYFALSVRGVQTKKNYRQLHEEIVRARYPAAFFEITGAHNFTSPQPIFEQYEKLNPGENITCLNPVREWLKQNIDHSFGSCQYVFDVHKQLGRLNRLGVTGVFNGDPDKPIELPLYTMDEINACIAKKSGHYV